MYSSPMRLGLCRLFAAMNGDSVYDADDMGCAGTGINAVVAGGQTANVQGELFAESGSREQFSIITPDTADIAIIAAIYGPAGRNLSALPFNARCLFELSVDAFDAIIRAWMSELPITGSIIRYGNKILAAAGMANNIADNRASETTAAAAIAAPAGEAEREAADTAATDRGDADVRTVLDAAYKVWHEIHRLMGLLRFCPDADGVYIARCEPDHFVLPALGPHFQERFGETPWAIIDEKRRLCLCCRSGGQPALLGMEQHQAAESLTDRLPASAQDRRGEWENLWRNYHTTINNESRHNLALQRQFMPRRYWKHLTELQE